MFFFENKKKNLKKREIKLAITLLLKKTMNGKNINQYRLY